MPRQRPAPTRFSSTYGLLGWMDINAADNKYTKATAALSYILFTSIPWAYADINAAGFDVNSNSADDDISSNSAEGIDTFETMIDKSAELLNSVTSHPDYAHVPLNTNNSAALSAISNLLSDEDEREAVFDAMAESQKIAHDKPSRGAPNYLIDYSSSGSKKDKIEINGQSFEVGEDIAQAIYAKAGPTVTVHEAVIQGLAQAAFDKVNINAASAGGIEAAFSSTNLLAQLVLEVRKVYFVRGQTTYKALANLTLAEVLLGFGLTNAYKYSDMSKGQKAGIVLAQVLGGLGIPILANLAFEGAPTIALTKLFGDNPVTAIHAEIMGGAWLAENLYFWIAYGLDRHNFRENSSYGFSMLYYTALTYSTAVTAGEGALVRNPRIGANSSWSHNSQIKFPRFRLHLQRGGYWDFTEERDWGF